MKDAALEARFQLEVGRGEDAFRLEAELALDRGVLVLFGPSGSGKSLTVQALAGLVRPVRGHIRLGSRTLFDSDARTHVPAHDRRIGYVPQNHGLFPFCDVSANVAFGLPRRDRRRDHPRVRALLEELKLEHLAHARPATLSGGERQRVALARALAVEPALLLLDEPFASIDADGRAEVRDVLRATLERHGTPAVFVTHDRDEAASLGRRIVRFERGRTLPAAPPTVLGARRRVRLRGRAGERTAGDAPGRSVVRLEGVELELPDDLAADLDGALELDLDARHGDAPEDEPA